MKIAVAGTGYVGLSIAVLLAQHNEVQAVDIVPAKVDMINRRQTPIKDEYIEKYLLEKERKKQKRNAKKPYEPYLEKLVVALVKTEEFPYNYETCMDLAIYKFNQSFKQIQHKISVFVFRTRIFFIFCNFKYIWQIST